MDLAKSSEYFRRRIMGTIPIVGASSFLGMPGWREEEGGGMDVIGRQTRLAELLSLMLLEGIIFPGAEEVIGLAEEMEKEKEGMELQGMSGELEKSLFDFRMSMIKLKEAGIKTGIKGKRREMGKEAFEKILEEKKKVEEEKKRLAEENQALKAHIQRLKEEKKQPPPAPHPSNALPGVSVSPPLKERVQFPRSAFIPILPPIYSLSSLSLTFCASQIKTKKNMIIHYGSSRDWELCLIGDVLRMVSLLFFILSLFA